MATPLFSQLDSLAKEQTLRLHIPGHKGKTLPYLQDIFPLDFTEIKGTGNLYEVGEPFAAAQALWAEKFSFPHCQFLTGGSTQGVYTALALSQGKEILLDRNAHRSAVHGCGLLGKTPVYLPRPWQQKEQVAGAITAEAVEKALEKNPQIKTVFLTSPTMQGILSDVKAIGQVSQKHGATLIVDGAHGAHLPWLGMNHFSGADLVCLSAHKTMPALGQGSMLLFRDRDPSFVGETASLFGTSSPSYLITASMDLARDWMEREGYRAYQQVAKAVAELRETFPSLKPPLALDPTRLTILHHQALQVAEQLEQQGIHLELSQKGQLVAVFTAQDSPEDILRFSSALKPLLSEEKPLEDCAPPSTLPPVKMPIQQVLQAEKRQIPLAEAVGKIAAATIAPYPPAVPVVVMGEEIRPLDLAYLKQVGYEKTTALVVAEPQ